MTPPASAAAAQPPDQPIRDFSLPTAAILVIGVLVMHIVTNIVTPYGFHRDEFLYLAMGEHLRLWHMDFPPFIAIVARVSHALFGESLPGLRLAPAFAHAGVVGATVYATALFGGRRSAQMLAGLGIALCPYFLRPGAMLQPVVFDQLWWTLALLGLTLRIHDDDPKHWAGTGLFLGLAALTKFSVAFLAAGFVVALLVTPLRRDLATKFPWVALIIATVIGHPSITGQIFLGWPVHGQFEDLRAEQLSHVSPLSFLTEQLAAGPVLFLAIGGIIWLFASQRRKSIDAGSGEGTLSLTSDP
ncbi:MAG: glycosyltransferase family 39 protein, partial [Gemmatimonadaceae bacterium]